MTKESTALASAVYEGVVQHCRHAPRAHAFRYRIAQLYVDLDELDRVFAGRWLWSTNHRNLAEFRRNDYLGPTALPLAEAVRRRVERHTGRRPLGPIRLLTHARYAGYLFNPVSFYYCQAPREDTIEAIVAEITNTPWNERHTYVLAADAARRHGDTWEWRFPKAFHVSPFLPIGREYLWRFTQPRASLQVHMTVLRDDARELDASLDLERRPLTGESLARVLWRYPLMTAQVIGAIHWQALRLWLKGTPVHDHPQRLGGTP